VWANWWSALVIVKPETVIAWHRKHSPLLDVEDPERQAARHPPVPHEVRDLIRRMSKDIQAGARRAFLASF
jgi:hypothetical protein